MHRPSNVDKKDTCQGIIEALIEISEDLPIVFPVHPRTKKNLESFGLMELVHRDILWKLFVGGTKSMWCVLIVEGFRKK